MPPHSPQDTGAGPSSTATSTPKSLLSFPAPESSTLPTPVVSQPRQILKDRIYVGNLHPSVDEHTLIKLFSKFGKIAKLDYLFHKTGPLKGKPRGYVFIEYANQDDTTKAISAAHDKVLRGRKLVVTHAHQAPLDQSGNAYGGNFGQTSRYRKGMLENRPTALSLLKTGGSGRGDDTQDKIARMEAKLRQMERPFPTSTPALRRPSLQLPAKPSSNSTFALASHARAFPSSSSARRDLSKVTSVTHPNGSHSSSSTFSQSLQLKPSSAHRSGNSPGDTGAVSQKSTLLPGVRIVRTSSS